MSAGTEGWQTAMIWVSGPIAWIIFDEVVDEIVQIEVAVRRGDHARVGPVGDVDFRVRQQGFHRSTQQGRVVADIGPIIRIFGSGRRCGSTARSKWIRSQNGFLTNHPLHHGDRLEVDLGLVPARRSACRIGAWSARKVRRLRPWTGQKPYG